MRLSKLQKRSLAVLSGLLVILAVLFVQAVSSSHNLFKNSSVEKAVSTTLPKGWTHGSWGHNSASYTYLNSGHSGSHSLKTTLHSYVSGAAYWHSDPIKVKGGKMYDFRDYYQSDIPSEIDATVIMKNGSEKDVYLGTAFASPDSWTKFDTQFSVPADAATITLYHDISAIGYLTTDDFSLSTFTYRGFDRPLVSITDDDGFTSFYQNGLPVLKKYNLPATEYIISSYIGSGLYMTADQIKQLPAEGVEIGSHSVDHPDLSTLPADKQTAELHDSQAVLQSLLGIKMTDYAAPYGAYNQQIVSKARQYYQSYRGTEPGYNAKNNFDPMNLQVQNITSKTTVADVQGWLNEAAKTNTWLVLVYHEISTSPSDTTYNTTPRDFDAQMRAVKNSNLIVKTVSSAFKETKSQL